MALVVQQGSLQLNCGQDQVNQALQDEQATVNKALYTRSYDDQFGTIAKIKESI
jgi:hypothetical protein